MTKKRNLSYLYTFYPYCKPHEPGITRPSLKNCTMAPNHKLAMSWTQWRQFMLIYFKYVKLFLLSGYQVILPNRMGVLQLHKKKGLGRAVNWERFNKTGEYTHYKNHHTGGYVPTFRWYRNSVEASIKNRFHWAMVLSKTFSKEISKSVNEDPSLLASYSTPSLARRASEVIKP